MSINIFSFVAFIHLLNYFVKSKLPDQKCPLYSKALLEVNECLFKQSPTSYLLETCPPKKKCELNLSKTSGKCKDAVYEYQLPAYPGGKCEIDSDCTTNFCSNGKCKGAALGEKCSNQFDCVFGLYCSAGYCVYPKPKNTQCQSTQECQMPFVCFEGTCQEIFIFEDGKTNIDENFAFLCKSGKVFNRQCNSVKSVNEYCDEGEYEDVCYYQDKNGKNIKVSGTCTCEYNMNKEVTGRRKCLRGNIENKEWDKVIKIIKKTLDPSNTNSCNLGEKRPGFCREILRNDWNARKDQILLEKYVIESRFGGHIPQEHTEKNLILNSLFGYDNTPPEPKNGFKCPSFKVGEVKYFNDQVCAYGNNPFNEEGSNITVFVRPKKCEKGSVCNFRQYDLYKNWEYNATCEKFKPIVLSEGDYTKTIKYPGEDCTSDRDCMTGFFEDVGNCVEGKCTGHSAGQKCQRHSDCYIGLFCNKDSKSCEPQRKVGESCQKTNDCENHLRCMNNTCFEAYSLPNGTYLEKKKKGDFVFKQLCKSNFVNEETNQCIDGLEYYNVKKEEIDENGFVRCKIGQKCNYTSGSGGTIYQKKCECGFNEEGLSFCPLSHSYREKEREKYFKLNRDKYKNKCHTLKRYECVDYETVDKISYYKKKSENAHLYYLAKREIETVLSSKGSFISLNFLLLLGFIFY